MTRPKQAKEPGTNQPASTLPPSAIDVEARDLELVEKWLVADQQWEADIANAPYDGILGTLPDWIPRGINSEFVRLRNNLLRSSVQGEKVTPALGLVWIDRYAKLGETDENTYIPDEVFEVVGLLARWRYIANLAPQKGLKELGVPSAKFQGRKRGALQCETVYIARLRKKFQHDTADDLYRTLLVIAQTPSNKRNPTPNECPFAMKWSGADRVLLKRGKPYERTVFRNALTDIDRRIARGEFPDL